MDDEGGGDEKIVAVPMPRLTMRYAYAHVTSIAYMPPITLEQGSALFCTTRTLSQENGRKQSDGAIVLKLVNLIVDAIVRANR